MPRSLLLVFSSRSFTVSGFIVFSSFWVGFCVSFFFLISVPQLCYMESQNTSDSTSSEDQIMICVFIATFKIIYNNWSLLNAFYTLPCIPMRQLSHSLWDRHCHAVQEWSHLSETKQLITEKPKSQLQYFLTIKHYSVIMTEETYWYLTTCFRCFPIPHSLY